MYKNKSIGVVIPAYNEEQLIGSVIDTLPSFVDFIIVIDDCSVDNTAAIVRSLQNKIGDKLVLLSHEKNRGVGSAIASGYIWCRDHSLDVTVVMDGDGQMDPNDLERLIDPVVNGEVDYAKGNRLVSGEAWKKIPHIRYMGNSILSLLTKIASGYWHVADSQTGFKAASLKVLQTIPLDKIYPRYGMPNDMLVKLNVYNFRVRDVEIRPIYGIGEKSGVHPIRLIPRLAWLLTRLFFWRMTQKYIIRDFHPLVFFYMIAQMLLGLFSPVLLIRLIVYWTIVGHIPPINALALMLVMITGLQFLLFGMWFDMDHNRNLR